MSDTATVYRIEVTCDDLTLILQRLDDRISDCLNAVDDYSDDEFIVRLYTTELNRVRGLRECLQMQRIDNDMQEEAA